MSPASPSSTVTTSAEAPPDAGAADPVEPAEPPEPPGQVPPERPGRLRLAGEAVGISLITLLLSAWAVPALRDRRQTVFQDVMINAMGPDRHGFAAWLDQGIWLPSWLRTNYGGEPYMANTPHGALYPGNFPFWFMPTSSALEVMLLVHFVIAAVGMWAYCRIGLRTSMWAGWLGAICFVLGGSTLAHITLGDQIQVIALVPVVFFTGHLALERRRLRWTVACAVAIGLAFLAGHAEEWLYVMVSLALYGAAWIAFRERTGQLRRLGQAVVSLGGAVALFALLFAWQLLPSLALRKEGYRNSASFNQQYPLPKTSGINALLPDYARVLVGENVAFVGFAALALVGLALVSRRRGTLWVRMWILVSAAIGFVFALGNQNRIYSFVYDHVSLIHSFRVPSRWLFMTSLALSVGAAIGLDELLTGYVGRWRARVGQGVAAVVALGVCFAGALLFADVANDGNVSWKRWGLAGLIGGLAWLAAGLRRVPRLVPALVLLAVTAVELVDARPGAEYRQKAPDVLYDAYGDNLETIGAEGGRYVTIAGPPKNGTQAAEMPVPADLPPGQLPLNYYRAGEVTRVIARSANNIATHAETIIGRDGTFMPLRRYRDFYYAVGGAGDLNSGIVSTPPSGWNWPALDLLAVRWFVTGDDLPEPERAVLRQHGFRIDGKFGWALRWERDGTSLARVVHQVDVLPAEADRIARLKSGYPLLDRALVEEPVQLDPAPAATSAAGDEVQVTEVGQTAVEVQATTRSRSLLVLADPWYPGWRVTVDGKSAELLRTDHTFRGVVLPAGTHTVRFSYVDRRLQAGVGLAVLTIVGLALTPLAAGYRRRRRDRPAGAPEPDGPDAETEDSADDPAETEPAPAEVATQPDQPNPPDQPGPPAPARETEGPA